MKNEIVTDVTAKQAFLMLACTEMKPFTKADWSAFAGCESASPTIGECEGHLLVRDGETLLVLAEGDEGGGQLFKLQEPTK